MKTKIKTTAHSQDYKKGEIGFVDGYVRNYEGHPFAVIVLKGRFALAPLWEIEQIYD